MPTSSEPRRAIDGDRPSERLRRATDERLALVIIGAAILASLALTVPFLGKDWLLGDLGYHRGVTLSIDIGHPFGEGPIAGVMSYYGGTYHLILAGISAVTGLTFAGAVAVLSAVWAVVWPLGLLALGRRLWPGDLLPAAVFVIAGTVAMPLSTAFATDLWVESVLPSGMALWAAYPRDLAVTFGIMGIVCFLDSRRLVRTVGTGLFVALAFTTHAQIAASFATVVIGWAVYRLVRGDGPRPLVDAVLALGLGALLSAWWWLPRVDPILSGPALLADAPVRLPFRMAPVEFAVQLSWIGVIALVAIVASVARRRAPGGHPILAVWIVVLLPLILFDRLAGGSALAPERRTWLQLSIPFAAIAAFELVDVLRRVGRPALAVGVAAVLVAATLPGAAATLYNIGRIWEDRTIAGRPWPAAEWDAPLAELRAMARGGPVEVLTYDTEAPWVWSMTGARVFSLWLPGPIKLGFDPEVATGLGFGERVRLATAAFDEGLPGICGLAEDREIGTVVMRSLDGLVATHDHAFAAPFRTDPAARARTPATRPLGPGLTYVDTGPDWLQIDETASVPIPFAGGDIQTVVVEARAVGDEPVTLTLRGDDFERRVTAGRRSGVQEYRFDIPSGAATGLTLESDSEVMLLRALGYEAVDLGQPQQGAFLVTSPDVCRAAGRSSAARW